MILPATLFSEITGCTGLRTERSRRESRRSPRIPAPGRTTVASITEAGLGAASPVRIRDFSTSGMSFLHVQSMEVGDEFAAVVPWKKSQSICIRCAVVRCQRVEAGMFIIGARFVCRLDVKQAPGQVPAAQAKEVAKFANVLLE